MSSPALSFVSTDLSDSTSCSKYSSRDGILKSRSLQKQQSSLNRCFFSLGLKIVEYQTVAIAVPVLISLCLSPLVLKMKFDGDLMALFIPKGSIHEQEETIKHNFSHGRIMATNRLLQNLAAGKCPTREETERFETNIAKPLPPIPRADPAYSLALILSDRSGGNLLIRNRLKALRKTVHVIEKELSVFSELDNRTWRYRDLCEKSVHCETSLASKMVSTLMVLSSNRSKAIRSNRFSYPIALLRGHPVNLGDAVFRVQVAPGSSKLLSFKGVSLIFRFGKKLQDNSYHVARNLFYLKAREILQTFCDGNKYECVLINPQSVNEAFDSVRKTGMPYILPTATSFLVLMALTNHSFWRKRASFAVEGIMGLVSVILALITSISILFGMGVPFNPFLIIVPFLVLCIGVDDSFIILAAYKKTSPYKQQKHRIATAMSEAGSSIALTTLTDVLCFLIGQQVCVTEVLSKFCLYCLVCIAIDFIYMVTFFPAVIAHLGTEKTAKSNCRCCGMRDTESEIAKFGSPNSFVEPRRSAWSKMLHLYSSHFLRNPYVRLGAIVTYIGYGVVSIYGCSTIKLDMTMKKLVVDGSDFQRYFEIGEKEMWSDFAPIEFYITRSPDFRRYEEVHKFRSFVRNLNSGPHALSKNSVEFWLDYHTGVLKFLGIVENTTQWQNEFYNPSKLSYLAKKQFTDVMTLNVSAFKDQLVCPPKKWPPYVRKFKFKIYFHGIRTWEQRQKLHDTLREKLGRYPEYGPKMIGALSLATDQRNTVIPISLQSLGLSTLAIILVTMLLFFFDFLELPVTQEGLRASASVLLHSVPILTTMLLSIQAGVVGFLNFWGVDLDVMSVVCILICSSLAVNSVAHFVSNFSHNDGETTEERVSQSLDLLTWPVFQAAASTVIGMTAVGFVPAYLTRAIYKSVVLVSVIGVYHGVVIVPVIYLCISKETKKT